MTTTPAPSLAALGALTASDPGYDDARRAWNLAVDQRPAAVVMPESAAAVAAAVRAARAAGLRVALQGTGHGASARGDLSGALLVNTSRMRGVAIDPAAGTARAEAGALWEDVVPAAAGHGLAALHGSSPDVGVVGYTLGGGFGWLGRSHGLACNAVTAVDLVTAAGDAVRVDAAGDPDLFWALRGGGGGFGAVTAIEFGLVPLRTVTAGWLMWPWEDARRVLGAWVEWTATVPDEVASVGRLLQLPPLPELPEFLRGRQLAVIEVAVQPGVDAGELLAPLRALRPEIDTVAEGPATALAALHMDPPEPVPGVGDGWLVDALPGEALDALLAAAGPGSGSPLVSVEARHLGGAAGRAPAGAGALDRIDGAVMFYAVGIAMGPDAVEPMRAAVATAKAALAPWGRGRGTLNFADAPADAATFFAPEAYARLRAIRARVDPDALLLPNHAIPGAA